MTFWIRLEFNESLDIGRLSRAMRTTSARHPLLSARIEYDSRRRPCWIPGPATGNVREFDSRGSQTVFPSSASVNLQSEPPWRAWVDSGLDNRVVWLEMHHAGCDGVGAFRAVDDLLKSYRDDSTPPPPDARQDWVQLAHRHRCDNVPGLAGRIQQWAWMVRRIAAYSATVPASLDTVSWPEQVPSTNIPPSEFRTRCLGSVEQYLRVAKQNNCTLNDLVTYSLFASLRDLFSRRNPNQKHRLRLFIPMDLRGNPKNVCQVSNVVGMFHIDRVVGPDKKTGTNPISLSSIAKEMKVLRRHQMGRALVVSLEAVTWILGSPAWLLSPHHCGATSVLTNLKIPLAKSELMSASGKLQMGSTILESVDMYPPIRPKTPACFGLLTYGNELRLTMRFQPATLPSADAESLLSRMTDQLQRLDLESTAVSQASSAREPS